MENLSATTLIAIDPDQFQKELNELNKKLDKLLSNNSNFSNASEVEWITSKKFMELVSIKAPSSFYLILDKMPERLKKKIGGKIYVHKDTVRLYFENQFN